jgi:hypothetical protein
MVLGSRQRITKFHYIMIIAINIHQVLKILEFYINQLVTFPAFSNVRTIKIFLNQLFALSSNSCENLLVHKSKIDYDSLINI